MIKNLSENVRQKIVQKILHQEKIYQKGTDK